MAGVTHPPAEFYEFRTPQEAYELRVCRATVDFDGEVTSWACAGQRGGTIKVTHVDSKWMERVYEMFAGVC